MTNIIKLDTMTKHDINAKEMLEEIAKECPENAFVISWPKDGGLPSYHSTTGDTPVVLYRLQEFVHNYYTGTYND